MFSLSLSMNKMENEFVPYKEALALKELGFDEPCFRWYDERWGDDLQQDKFNTNKDLFMTDLDCSAPLYQQAFRWFREKYDLCGIVLPFGEGLFDYRIYSAKEGKHLFGSPEFKTYEEANLHCLIKLIKIVKNK